MIKHAQSRQIARDAVVLDLGDLRRQADRLRERAEAEAEAIRSAAAVEADRIIEEAMQRGFDEGKRAGAEQGRAAGYEAGRNEAYEVQFATLRSLVEKWGEALETFEGARDRLLREARQDVLELAVRLAERVLKRELPADRGAAARQLSAVLDLAIDASALRVDINPGDEAAVSDALPGLLASLGRSAHAEIALCSDVEPGGCRVHTGSGAIDASIHEQMRRLIDDMLPAGRSARWSEPAAAMGAEDSGVSEAIEDPPGDGDGTDA